MVLHWENGPLAVAWAALGRLLTQGLSGGGQLLCHGNSRLLLYGPGPPAGWHFQSP